ncbi:MAG: COX aromatic rich motif-containing protein [Methylobacteriaceae bacterium]|nr:COX aromatic rich motif-containing protein [Methylobacteriaceae bacterium]
MGGGRPVSNTITSSSVMNTFFVPQLGSMIYTMNGMATRLHLHADRAGTYYGRSGHFSGDGFPDMQFAVKAVSQPAFEQWVAQAKGGGAALDGTAYDELARQSVLPVSTYRSVQPNLFQEIVTQMRPPGPGPEPEVTPKGNRSASAEPNQAGPAAAASSPSAHGGGHR